MTGDSGSQSPTPFHVLVLGGSYGGLSTALNLLDLCRGEKARGGIKPPAKSNLSVGVTIIDERDGFFHLIGAPLALVEEKYAARAWVKYEEIPALRHPDVRLLQGSVESVDCKSMMARTLNRDGSKTEHRYDYLVAATGMRRRWPTVPQSLDRKLYLEDTQRHIDLVKAAQHGIVVIGGGAVGIEMAAETKTVYPDIKVTLVHSRDHLLSAEPLPNDFKTEALKLLRNQGVEVIVDRRVTDVISGEGPDTRLQLSDGSTMHATHVINAISKPIATTTYLTKTALDAEGDVRVRSTLQFTDTIPNSHSHFAVGDIAAWPPAGHPHIKRCGGAMYQGHAAAANIHQHMLHRLGLIERRE